MPKVSELNAITSVANSDLLMVVHDPSGSPSTNKVTLSNLGTSITAALKTANSTIAGTIKVGSGLAISNGVLSANTLSILPSSNTNEGYVLTWDDEANAAIWAAFSGVQDYTLVNSANSYTAEKHDNVLFVDPNAISQDIKIILPDTQSDPAAIAGKSYFIKNINNGGQYKVRVTTYSGENVGSNYLENPVTGSFVVSYDLVDKGSGDQWIFDGTVWRHITTQRAVPVFYTSVDTYAQVAVKNASASNNASADVVMYNNLGNIDGDAGPYIDIGINSSTYNVAEYNIGGPSDGYVYNKGGDLAIGTGNTGTSLIFHTGGTTANTQKMAINASGVFVNSSIIFADGTTQNTAFTGSGTGYSGSIGFTGSAGTTGYTGSVGDTGSIGTTGFTGSIGTTGYTGSIGFTGSEGSQGTTGFTGSEGTGFAGSQGTTGYTGSAGAISSPVSILKIDDGVQEAFQNISNANGVVTHDCSSGQIFYHTTPANNFTANVTNLNMDSGYATTLTLVISQGSTGYYANALHINGVAQSIRWQSNSTPTPGTNRTDVITFSILNSSGTYITLGQLTGF